MGEREWGRCGFEGMRGVKIVTWIDDKNSPHSFLREWTSTIHPRPLILKPFKQSVSEYVRDAKTPLKGMTFACAGRLFKRSLNEFKTLVISNGGKFSEDINVDVDYVVSTYSELLLNRPKISRAKQLDIAIVTELLVDRLLEEFGFDQSEYLLYGRLPPIAYAKLVTTSTLKDGDKGTLTTQTISNTKDMQSPSEQINVRKGQIYPEANCPNGKIYTGCDEDDKDTPYDVLLTQERGVLSLSLSH
jgi:hypothetical protein